ncbi:NADH-quinone oxidoreductase subunit C, partial [Persephonella sp.]
MQLWIDNQKLETVSERFENINIQKSENFTSIQVEKNQLIQLLKFLKEDLGFKMFIDFFCVDYPLHNPRFQGIYLLFNPDDRQRVAVKCWAEGDSLPTITHLWKGAKWAEREAWDMFGVKFEGHENLVRMFLWEGYKYHP